MVDDEDDIKTIIEESFHDLNNHLAAINGFSAILVKALQDLPVEKDFSSKILEAGEEATNLSEQLFEVLKNYFDDGQ